MKTYQCFKRVLADKIVRIERSHTSRIHLKGGDFVDVPVSWMEKHKPHTGGYFVRYPDGYESYSPADAFESGYEVFDRRTTLEAFMEMNVKRGAIDFSARASIGPLGVEFYIHPYGVDGDTLDFVVDGNYLLRK